MALPQQKTPNGKAQTAHCAAAAHERDSWCTMSECEYDNVTANVNGYQDPAFVIDY